MMKRSTNTYVKIGLGIVLLVLIGTYSYTKSQDFLAGPTLSIEHPQNGVTLSESYVEIRGMAKNITTISMNDQQIFVDENGIFREGLLLAPGYNIITVKASDRFDRVAMETLELVFK